MGINKNSSKIDNHKQMNMKSLLTYALLIIGLIPVKGQAPSNFELQSATDNQHFNLSEARGNYVALHFLLKTECPYCLRHTQEYFRKAETLPDVIQVFIKPDTKEEIEAWALKLPDEDLIKYPIYRDPDAKLADQFGIPGGYSFHNQVVHFPALVLLDPDGKEVFRYIGKNNADRFSFDQLADKIRELKAK
jgi:peroxiredoxin Q/BCP